MGWSTFFEGEWKWNGKKVNFWWLHRMYPSLPSAQWTPQNQACSLRIFTKRIQSIFSVFYSNDFFITNTLKMTTVQPTQKIQISQGITPEPKLCSVKEEVCASLSFTPHRANVVWNTSLVTKPWHKYNSDINDASATAAPSLSVIWVCNCRRNHPDT